MGDALIPEAAVDTFTPRRLVVASAGADLATPVAYWFQKHPLRVRVGSTTAAAVPATSGLLSTITQNAAARGVLRMGLADVDAAAHIILDQGGLKPLPCGSKNVWDAYFHVANVTNGDITAANGYAEFGVIGGVASVDPTAVLNAAGVIVRITNSLVSLISIATTETVINSRPLPSGDFVLWFRFDPDSRALTAYVDTFYLGSYTLPTAVTALEMGGRVVHKAAYTALGAAPLGVDLDSMIYNVPVAY
jgi:hypothetical protein